MADLDVTNEYQKGGEIGLLVLRALEAMSEAENHPEVSTSQYIASKQQAADFAVRASGAASKSLQGFIAVMAEYIHFSQTGGGIPNLAPNGWKPIALMTDAELKAHHRQLDGEEVAA